MISLNIVRIEPVAKEGREIFDVTSGEAGGKLMVTRGTGRRVREALGEVLERLPSGGVLYVDTRDVELMDYSFADEALGILASRVAGGEYGEKRVVLVEEDRELLENIEAPLRRRGVGRGGGAAGGSGGRSELCWSRRTGSCWRTSKRPCGSGTSR